MKKIVSKDAPVNELLESLKEPAAPRKKAQAKQAKKAPAPEKIPEGYKLIPR